MSSFKKFLRSSSAGQNMSTGSLAATGSSEMSSNEPIGSANDGDEVVGDSDVSIIPSDDEIEDEDVDGITIDDANLPWTPQSIELDVFEARPFKSRTPIGAAERADLPVKNLDNPLFWFDKFWTHRMTTITVRQTNLFQSQSDSDLSPSKDASHGWYPLSSAEWDIFMACLFVMGVESGPVSPTRLWSGSTVRDRAIKAMSRNRFKEIKRFLHFADKTKDKKKEEQGYDCLYKVRTLLTELQKQCRENWNPSQFLSMDEMDVPFCGLHAHKERITYKKAGDGFLVYALCDKPGYVFDFSFKMDSTWKRGIDGLKPTFSIVLDLIERMQAVQPTYEYGVLFVDNLHGSIPLARSCLQRKIYFTSTARKNRVPPEVKTFVLQKNQYIAYRQGNVTVVKWKDRNECRFITTYYRPVIGGRTTRRKAAFDSTRGVYRRMDVLCGVLNVSQGYNENMNNVDVADQIRTYFSTRQRSRKWYHAHFHWVLDTCACNAYCMYKSYFERRFPSGRRDDNGKKVPILKHRDFLLRLITALLDRGASTPSLKRRRRSISSSASSDFSVASRRRLAAGNSASPSSLVNARPCSISEHPLGRVGLSSKGHDQKRVCVYCKSIKKTVFVCEGCDVGLHPQCFTEFHCRM